MTIEDLEEHAAELHREASQLLETLPWMARMRQLGAVRPVGSYALHLMTWPDLDLHWVVPEHIPPEKAFSALIESLIPDMGWQKANFRNFQGDYKPHWPRGLYLGLELRSPLSDRVWKIDIWVQSAAVMEAGQRFLGQIEAQMTPERRSIILEAKHRLMQGLGRVPKMGSYHLYQAVCLHGVHQWPAIEAYLREQGVQLNP
jgi:hypothetical protein